MYANASYLTLRLVIRPDVHFTPHPAISFYFPFAFFNDHIRFISFFIDFQFLS